jgi:ADP-ribosylglycohydrolase
MAGDPEQCCTLAKSSPFPIGDSPIHQFFNARTGQRLEMTGMIGAIAGDIIGSVYEVHPIKTKAFPLFHPRCRFTDDSVLTIAVAQAILADGDFRRWVWEIGRRYPHAGYGGAFIQWLHSSIPEPYNSWGNGAAMRVSPVGWAFDDADAVLREAARTAAISHNHPEGIKGAQATALAVFLARTTREKALIKREVTYRFGYDLGRTVESIRPSYGFDVSCQGTVPEAIVAFLEAASYEDAVRNAVSLGGDSDTLACITGAIAEAFYGPVAPYILEKVKGCLTKDLWSITEQFCRQFAPDHANKRIAPRS